MRQALQATDSVKKKYSKLFYAFSYRQYSRGFCVSCCGKEDSPRRLTAVSDALSVTPVDAAALDSGQVKVVEQKEIKKVERRKIWKPRVPGVVKQWGDEKLIQSHSSDPRISGYWCVSQRN